VTAHGRVAESSWWTVERDNGRHCTGCATRERAHDNAKPRGRRTRGVVIRHDITRSFLIDGDVAVETTTTRRTVEATA
jgi:hypothetical protein